MFYFVDFFYKDIDGNTFISTYVYSFLHYFQNEGRGFDI